MIESDLHSHIGHPIRYDIGPHFEWKDHAEGVGILRYYAEQGWWYIVLPDGRHFVLQTHLLALIEFDRYEGMLHVFYAP